MVSMVDLYLTRRCHPAWLAGNPQTKSARHTWFPEGKHHFKAGGVAEGPWGRSQKPNMGGVYGRFPHICVWLARNNQEYLDLLCPAVWDTDSSSQIETYTVKRAHTHTHTYLFEWF